MLVLQWIGGGCYLLNKVFLSFSERARKANQNAIARRWRISSWAIYLVGLPAWVFIFIEWHNWIAASVEASGAPAMLLGLITAIGGKDKKAPRWLDQLAMVCIPLGFAYSLYDFGGLNNPRQWLEIGLVIGFLVGTYQLAKERASGYVWYVLMHLSAGTLMWVQHFPWLTLQQVVSLGFIADAWLTARKQRLQGTV